MADSASSRLFAPRFLVLVGMIAFAVATRLITHFVPAALPYNFTPVESIALFGGAYFLDRRFAFAVPLAAMFLADLVIGLHDLIPVVYACIALTVALGFTLRDKVDALRVAGYSIGSAAMFFGVTNFFVWLSSGMYPLDSTGFIACYAAAIPFFKNTLLGTLFWSALLFGGFELLRRQYPALQPAHA